jgi:hypothetical protein
VWINGHEWAKRQATKAGIGFTALSNGFATCDDPTSLQDICDRLGPGTINVFLERWLARLPLPFDQADRAAGYWWEASMRQVEVSRTIVFDAPRQARGFFEALIVDNLDLGRPHNVEIIFGRRVRRDTPGTFRTAIDRRDNGGVLLNVFYKHSRIKQYLKRRPRDAHRDRRQHASRPGLPRPAAQPGRPTGQGPCMQPADPSS